MISIEVTQNGSSIRFAFKEMYFEDAMKFAGNCIETGENGTKVSISITKEED